MVTTFFFFSFLFRQTHIISNLLISESYKQKNQRIKPHVWITALSFLGVCIFSKLTHIHLQLVGSPRSLKGTEVTGWGSQWQQTSLHSFNFSALAEAPFPLGEGQSLETLHLFPKKSHCSGISSYFWLPSWVWHQECGFVHGAWKQLAESCWLA